MVPSPFAEMAVSCNKLGRVPAAELASKARFVPGFAVYLTGQAGDGKSTLLRRLEVEASEFGFQVQRVDFSDQRAEEALSTLDAVGTVAGGDDPLLVAIDGTDELFGKAEVGDSFSYLLKSLSGLWRRRVAYIVASRSDSRASSYLVDQQRSLARVAPQRRGAFHWAVEPCRSEREVRELLEANHLPPDRICDAAALMGIGFPLTGSDGAPPSRLDWIFATEIAAEPTPGDRPRTDAELTLEFAGRKLREAGSLDDNLLLQRLADTLAGDTLRWVGGEIAHREWRSESQWVMSLAEVGLLSVQGSVKFRAPRIGDALAAQQLIKRILSGDTDDLPRRRDYFSSDYYRYVAELSYVNSLDAELIDAAQMLGLEWQFELAVAMTYHPAPPQKELRAWWARAGRTPRIWQKVSEALLVAGDDDAFRQFLAELPRLPFQPRHTEPKGLDFPLIIHRGRSLDLSSTLCQSISAAFQAAPAARKYLASMLARGRCTRAASVLNASLTDSTLAGRHLRYVIAALGDIGGVDDRDALLHCVSSTEDRFGLLVIRSDLIHAIASIEGRLGLNHSVEGL